MSQEAIGIGDMIEVHDRGTVFMVNDKHVSIRRDDGTAREYNLTGSFALKVRVIEKAYVDGGVYIDSDNKLLKYRSGPPSNWQLFNHYAMEFDEWISSDMVHFPVTRLV